jgi:hypothetical protein
MSKAQRVQFTCAKVVMDSAQDIIGRFYAEITNLGISDTSRLLNQAYVELLEDVRYDLLKCV